MIVVGAGPLSAEPKKGPAQTPLKGHALICSVAALLSLCENRTTTPQARATPLRQCFFRLSRKPHCLRWLRCQVPNSKPRFVCSGRIFIVREQAEQAKLEAGEKY